ncbi:MAG: hypothetical protein BGP06_20715 [Rhizobiales bacterium 65-9]|nr:MAG: hypothetical protein BGP06_20715 [Rhizobiales bacterium 65-9]
MQQYFQGGDGETATGRKVLMSATTTSNRAPRLAGTANSFVMAVSPAGFTQQKRKRCPRLFQAAGRAVRLRRANATLC